MLNETKFKELRETQAELAALADREATRDRELNDARTLVERLENTLHQALSDPRSTWTSVAKLETDLLGVRQLVARLGSEQDPTTAAALEKLRGEVVDMVYELSGRSATPDVSLAAKTTRKVVAKP